MQRYRPNTVRLGPPSMAPLVCLATERGVPAIRIRSTVIVPVFRAQPTHWLFNDTACLSSEVSPRKLLAVQPGLDLTAKCLVQIYAIAPLWRGLFNGTMCVSLGGPTCPDGFATQDSLCVSNEPRRCKGSDGWRLTVLSALARSLPRAWPLWGSFLLGGIRLWRQGVRVRPAAAVFRRRALRRRVYLHGVRDYSLSMTYLGKFESQCSVKYTASHDSGWVAAQAYPLPEEGTWFGMSGNTMARPWGTLVRRLSIHIVMFICGPGEPRHIEWMASSEPNLGVLPSRQSGRTCKQRRGWKEVAKTYGIKGSGNLEFHYSQLNRGRQWSLVKVYLID